MMSHQAACKCSLPALIGIASWIIPLDGGNTTWKVLRAGTGKVKSPTGRWTDFSSIGIAPISTNITPSSSKINSTLYFAVQWSQRQVQCGEPDIAAASAAAAAWKAVQQQQQQQQEQTEFQNGVEPAAGSELGDYEYEPVCAMPGPWIGLINV
jgi:hypothetical protein